MIRTIKVRTCDLCEVQQQKGDNPIKPCPICNKDMCENCSQAMLDDIFGKAGSICEKCVEHLSPMKPKSRALFKKQFYQPIIDFCKKIVLVENL